MQTRVLLVGVGGYGGVYVKSILGERARPDVWLAGVVDPFAQSAATYPLLEAAGARIYPDIASFYRENEAELAVIATPIYLHAEQSVACLQHGSHVLLEKPLAATLAEADKIISARDKCDRLVSVGFQWCCDGAMRELYSLVRSGELGRAISMRAMVIWPRDKAYYSRGGGWAGRAVMPDGRPVYDSVASNATAHYLFNMLWLAGEEIVGCEGETYRANEIETYDTAFAKYRLRGGGEIFFCATHAGGPEKIVEPIFEYKFENGTARYDSRDGLITLDGRVLGKSSRDENGKLWKMADAVRGEAEVFCPPEEARRLTQAIELLRAASPVAARFRRVRDENNMVWAEGAAAAVERAYSECRLPGGGL